MSFTGDINRWVDKTVNKMERVHSGVALEMSKRVIMRTPVDTGRARANWQASLGSPSSSSSLHTDRGGGATTAKAAEVAEGFGKKGQTFYLVNNVDYIKALEHGHSKQAPAGMVKVTENEFEGIVGMVRRSLG